MFLQIDPSSHRTCSTEGGVWSAIEIFCLFHVRSSSCSFSLAWLHSSCSTAHCTSFWNAQENLTKPCVSLVPLSVQVLIADPPQPPPSLSLSLSLSIPIDHQAYEFPLSVILAATDPFAPPPHLRSPPPFLE